VQARKQAKLTQIEAAKRTGMSQGTLGELEMEGQGSSYTAQLAGTYGVSSTWLATGKGDMLAKEEFVTAQPKPNPPLQIVQPQENHELNDAVKLLALFSQATPAGKSFILQMADSAEKIIARRSDTAAGN